MQSEYHINRKEKRGWNVKFVKNAKRSFQVTTNIITAKLAEINMLKL